jgi:hypothetical protein
MDTIREISISNIKNKTEIRKNWNENGKFDLVLRFIPHSKEDSSFS